MDARAAVTFRGSINKAFDLYKAFDLMHAERVVSQRWNSDSPGRIASIIQEFCLGHSLAICAGPESPIRISILPVDRLLVGQLERGVKLTLRLHTAIG
jgi:hypothetical protein